jgi:hypothetical protein
VVPVLMWGDGIQNSFEFGLRSFGLMDKIPGTPSVIFWAIRELIWWWFVSVLTTIIVLFAVESPLGRQVGMCLSGVKSRLPEGV